MPRTILLVEDQSSIRRLASRVLSGASFRVLEAESGNEALEIAAGEPGPIDLLVTDVMMPGMNGREVAERLVAARPELRVLFVSGYPDDARFLERLAPGRSEFLQKPFSPAGLVDAARRLVEGGGSAGES